MILLWNSAEMTVTMSLVDGVTRHDFEWQADRSLAKDMLAYVRDKCLECGYDLSDISGIGVYKGPGSYTGLRIGLTVLNTFASATHIPIVGVSDVDWQQQCLDRLAQGADEKIILPEYGGDAHVTQPRK